MKIEWDFHELFDFGEEISNLTKFNLYLEKATQEIAEKLHHLLIENTPVDFGNLQMGWKTPENYSYMVERTPEGLEVTLINKTLYALWVNDGHKQRPGRFIPGYWEDSRHFRYDPTAKGGMVLVRDWVKGRFFVEISIATLDASTQIEQIVYKNLQKWWKECLKG